MEMSFYYTLMQGGLYIFIGFSNCVYANHGGT